MFLCEDIAAIKGGKLRIVFLGDISTDRTFPTYGDFVFEASNVDCVLANLEGAIVSEENLLLLAHEEALALTNPPAIVDVLRYFGVRAVCLANNHMYDLNQPALHTANVLARSGIASFGAGANLKEANTPFVFQQENGTTVKVFAFNWDVIGGLSATENSEGVNPFVPKDMLNIIRQLRSIDLSSFIVFITHWNYELELYPQPAHRELAHNLIEAGVDAIIGLHPHVVQGAELISGKPIIYSIGNWFFPERRIGHFLLKYPQIASRELALELEVEGRELKDIRFHWHQFDREQNMVIHEKTEDWSGTILRELSPFVGMSHSQYIKWFRRNRTRRKGLPIYRSYHAYWENFVKDNYVKSRQHLISLLVRLGLKRGLQE